MTKLPNYDNVRFQKTLQFIDGETMRSNEEFVAHFRASYDIHRLSMAIPTGFEKSALWEDPDAEEDELDAS